MSEGEAFLALTHQEARTIAAVFERMFPADNELPGATEIGATAYLDRALGGVEREFLPLYQAGLTRLDAIARARSGHAFADCSPQDQDALLGELEQGVLPDWVAPPQVPFFAKMRAHLQEGLFSDPAYGGNRDKLGWQVLGHPGVWLRNSAEENVSQAPVTKGGRIQSLADVGEEIFLGTVDEEIAGYDPQRGAAEPTNDADVILIGVGGVGGFIAPVLAKAGLKVVGLEAGHFWKRGEFLPDELGNAFYCRANMSTKFRDESPRWRRRPDAPSQEMTYSLGRMVNGVGGSIIHYGGWLRRFPAHAFRTRSYALERWGTSIIPEGATVVDWPLSYEELLPYFAEAERISGVAGDSVNNLLQGDAPFPLPATRPFRMGELFIEAATDMGLHPHHVPVGMTTRPYNGFPEMTYTAWDAGFGSWTGDKWHPGLTSVREALATGNFDLRTECRVTRILTDSDGRARGVEYLDPLGNVRQQMASTVIMAAYTFESVRLMFLSGDDKRPDGLGNSSGQLGKHYMTKMFPHVDGYFPDVVFNRHTGPAAQAVVLDDFVVESFDSGAHGFLGGATLGAENQFLPIQISRETLPPDVPRWGQGYKDHIREWQHFAVVRIQPDALSYEDTFIDMDPHTRERSRLGMPVVRVTYDLHQNELRIAEYMEQQCDDILRAMGATRTWRGPRFTGTGSSHDLGGCRMGDDPAASVVDRHLQVHDTPGLYVFSGATFPTCPGINPTLTLWAVVLHAANALIGRLQSGEER